MAKILLVEDDNNLREIFEARLQAEGYETVIAGNGEEGLTVAMREKPDLIIADVMMPKLSGFEMLETLRAAPDMKDTKVIMMTALGQAEDQARGESLGVIRYLVKSQATLEDFARVVSEVLPSGHSPAAAPGSPNEQASENNNQQERQVTMQEDPTTNPTPGADSGAAAPGSNPMDGGAAPAAPATDGQQSTADEQAGVQSQIDSFAGSTPAADSGTPAPAGDSAPGADQGSFAPATPPADAPATDNGSAPEAPAEPEASGEQAPGSTPSDSAL